MKEIGTEGKFYFQGKWFDSFEEMMAYTIEWHSSTLDEETAGRILDRFKKDILFNVFMCGPEMTNQQFSNLIEDLFHIATSKPR